MCSAVITRIAKATRATLKVQSLCREITVVSSSTRFGWTQRPLLYGDGGDDPYNALKPKLTKRFSNDYSILAHYVAEGDQLRPRLLLHRPKGQLCRRILVEPRFRPFQVAGPADQA
jgi:hypothetical protein